MRSFLPSLGVVGALGLSLVSGVAHANKAGITGRSGKQGASCVECHTGGQAPTVTLEGPTSLVAGQTGNYALIVRGGPAVKAGMNVATSVAGATLGAGANVKKAGDEVTHTAPLAFTDGAARFEFTMVAPSTNGTVRLFGAGNSTNNNDASTGDSSALTTLDVQVTGGTDPAPEKDSGGCSATGAMPLMGAVLALAGLRRRRAA
ncbi:hypothetical protein DRW03_25440 [Corallococcus sp. H22C18031201]|uniref:MXAN_6652 family MXYO-CTERM-anchored protein n=1 Tax=Citreicoccus inhibens TaxID=2849499 RepID=UPI000E729F5A|nr:MXAN_6652 family MXYO-CTERM-anchored protein [Citreicoccus inhibens]MBU8898956.1 hypothetical protein [Citreicoccus inhibens]RJS18466.1 hypothetical protein DRW03_25440 [Corallococcus sp. H22C18031201]